MFFGENPPGPAQNPLPPIFEIALPELFSAHVQERRDRMGGVVGVGVPKPSRFSGKDSQFPILKKLTSNSQLHAEANSERIWIECGALSGFDYAKFIASIGDLHTSERSAHNINALLRSLKHDFADLFEAGNSQPGTC